MTDGPDGGDRRGWPTRGIRCSRGSGGARPADATSKTHAVYASPAHPRRAWAWLCSGGGANTSNGRTHIVAADACARACEHPQTIACVLPGQRSQSGRQALPARWPRPGPSRPDVRHHATLPQSWMQPRELGIRDAQADSPERIGNSRRTRVLWCLECQPGTYRRRGRVFPHAGRSRARLHCRIGIRRRRSGDCLGGPRRQR